MSASPAQVLHIVQENTETMTDIEKRIADIILKNYDEDEQSYPYSDYRLYITANGVIKSQNEMTDVLFVQYTEIAEPEGEYLQVFLSSPDDMAQDFVYFGSLTEDEQKAVIEGIVAEVGTKVVL